jgi:Neuraminidase (sialidase)
MALVGINSIFGGEKVLKNSQIVLELPPKEGNARNSEGAFIDLKDGRILFIYTKYIGNSYDDDARAGLAAYLSNDQGVTWYEEGAILAPEENILNIMSVSLLRLLNGDIGLFYLIRRGPNDTRLHLSRSADEGKTWSKPLCCVPGPGYYVTNNDRVIRLKSGRIIFPSAFHRLKNDNLNDIYSLDFHGIAYFFISDDDGNTWREADNFCSLNMANTKTGLQEPGIVELKNGTLYSWSRTDQGVQYEMFSPDNGETWTKPSPSFFSSPCSPLSMKRCPENGYLFAVWNPIPIYNTRTIGFSGGAGRTPLVGAFSNDEGRTWGDIVTIDDNEEEGYCYTAIHFIKGGMLLAYCSGGKEDASCLARLRLRRFTIQN